MPGDIERVTFDPRLLFANVELQQGRLLLPADFNEQSAIHHHFLRRLIVDLVGKRWRAGGGFVVTAEAKPDLILRISAGRFYVDGIMCENNTDCLFTEQPFGPVPDDVAEFDDDAAAVYLECWERHVNCLQFPSLRDPALGGVDTATRIQIAWQARLLSKGAAARQGEDLVKAIDARIKALDPADSEAVQALKDAKAGVQKAVRDFDNDVTCATAAAVIDTADRARPRLAADAKDGEENPEPCAISRDSEYRGRENQLYRVEIHRPGPAGKATFKWSRENASVAFRIVDLDPDSKAKVTRVSLETLGRDRRTGLCAGDWVELVDDHTELLGRANPLLRVTDIDAHRRRVTLEGLSDVLPDRHAILRRWDQPGDGLADALPVRESKDVKDWIGLERGVRIRFAPGGFYRTGDYWLIAARVATGDIEWPADDGGKPLSLEPHGVERHRAVLATVKKEQETWKADAPCSCTMKPLCG
jgi:hypothetical protein